MNWLSNLRLGKNVRIGDGKGRPRLNLDPARHGLIYVIGDVHGCFDELLDAERRIAADAARRGRSALMVTLGDHVDRGPFSAQVVNHLIGAAPPGFDRLSLCGNHDDAFLAFLRSPARALGWLEFGGIETLRSYGVDAPYLLRSAGGIEALSDAIVGAVPSAHRRFLETLPVAIRLGDFLLVHAGIVPGRAIEEQRDADFMWMREPFLEVGPQLPLTVVHGHTPRSEPEFAAGRIGIDTGVYMTGRLTVLRIEDGTARVLD